MKITVKTTGKTNTACMLYEVGINNFDMYVYLDQVYRSEFKSFGLSSVAETLGLGEKLHMPSESETKDMSSMIEYNLHDSRLTRKVFEKLDIASHVGVMCSVMKTIMVDVCRNTTGAMCACMLSSYALSMGKVLDWSKCSIIDNFEGGLVLDPLKGLHNNHASCNQ